MDRPGVLHTHDSRLAASLLVAMQPSAIYGECPRARKMAEPLGPNTATNAWTRSKAQALSRTQGQAHFTCLLPGLRDAKIPLLREKHLRGGPHIVVQLLGTQGLRDSFHAAPHVEPELKGSPQVVHRLHAAWEFVKKILW